MISERKTLDCPNCQAKIVFDPSTKSIMIERPLGNSSCGNCAQFLNDCMEG